MLIQHIADTQEGGLGAIDSADVSDLEVLYKASKKHFDDDPDFKKRAQLAVKSLQGGDPLFIKARPARLSCALCRRHAASSEVRCSHQLLVYQRCLRASLGEGLRSQELLTCWMIC